MWKMHNESMQWVLLPCDWKSTYNNNNNDDRKVKRERRRMKQNPKAIISQLLKMLTEP